MSNIQGTAVSLSVTPTHWQSSAAAIGAGIAAAILQHPVVEVHATRHELTVQVVLPNEPIDPERIVQLRSRVRSTIEAAMDAARRIEDAQYPPRS